FQILITDNGGKTWTKVPDAALPPALDNEGAFAGSGTNIAVFGTHAWIGTGAGPKSRMLHTADRGKSWTVADTPIVANASTGIFSVAFRDAQHGVAIGGDYSKEKLGVDNAAITSDGGKTWTLVKVSGFRSVVRYIPGAPTSLIAVGPQGADMSTDDGKTWTPMEIPAPMTGWHTLALSPNGKVGFAAGGRGAVAKVDLR
ncbi:MAG: oxidoreductase, partial [Acidobacteria bacterium]|nr:oxidoreductase [Acidobacteriota bacterium]